MRWALALMALVVVGCQSTQPQPPPTPPAPRKVVVTDTAPSNAVVERSVARVERRVAETSSKVDEVSSSVSAAVERAIRANDEETTVIMKSIRAQVDELRVGLKLAQAESEAMAEEVASTKALVEKMQAERDQARQDEAKAILAHETAQKEYQINIALERKNTTVEKEAKEKMTKRATRLGITLGVLSFAVVAYIAWKIFK